MIEGFSNPQENRSLSPEEVVQALNGHEKDAPEAIEILRQFVDQCHDKANQKFRDGPDARVSSHRANIEAEMEVAEIFLQSPQYVEDGLQSLEDAYCQARQDEEMADLAKEIYAILMRPN